MEKNKILTLLKILILSPYYGIFGGFIGIFERYINHIQNELKAKKAYPHRYIYNKLNKKIKKLKAEKASIYYPYIKSKTNISKLDIQKMYDLDKKIFYIEQNYMKGEFTPPSFILNTLLFTLSTLLFLPCFILYGIIYKCPKTILEKQKVNTPSQQITKTKRKLILCVDDTVDILDSLKEYLEPTNKYVVITAKNSSEGKNAITQHVRWGGLAKNNIDSIILDVRMDNDHEDGLKFLKWLRQSESLFDTLPVILLSGNETSSIWMQATHNKMGQVSAYLKKPIEEQPLLDTLEKILFKKHHSIMIEKTKETYFKEETIKPLFSSTSKPKILHIEDETSFAENIKEILEDSAQFNQLIHATNGKEALQILHKNKTWFGYGKNNIDIILLDINMPQMTGLEFLKIWRNQEKTQCIPVIMLTAWEDKDKWKKATNINEGLISAYLKKPISKEDLITTLDSIYNNKFKDIIDETRQKGYERIKELSN